LVITEQADPIRFDDRLLAEAVRIAEANGEHPLAPSAAPRAPGALTGGDLEARVVRRARLAPVAPLLRDAIARARRASAWAVALLMLVAAASGGGAAQAALGAGRGDAVNFYAAIVSLLGLQTLLLLAWILLVAVRPHMVHVSPLGGAAMAAARWLSQRGGGGPMHLAGAQAYGTVLARGAIGRWTLSGASHAIWAAANAGALAMMLVLLSTREYAFTWETTILSSDVYARVTEALAAAPRAAGFLVPAADEIERAQHGRLERDPAAAQAWSGLLVGSLVAYGLAPRGLLAAASMLLAQRARRRFRLDLDQPGFAPALAPPPSSRPSVRPDAEESALGAARAGPGGAGPPAIVGLEIEAPACGWPPPVAGLAWRDLGVVDGAAERHRAIDALAAHAAPSLTVVVASLAATPDRGLGGFIESAGRAARGPLAIVLTGGQRLRDRVRGGDALHEAVARRVDDWRALAARCGVPAERVVEIDLDHLTRATTDRLAALVGAAPHGGAAPARRIEEAFSIIADAAGRWTTPPDAPAQALLHRRIAEIYRGAAASWIERLPAPEGFLRDGAAARDALARAARSAVGLLPAHLRLRPRWLAAGAAAGALGCIAAASLVAPVAIGALPIWSALGAAIAGAAGAATRAGSGDDAAVPEGGEERTAGAVRAAALFALLLELQGRPEASIARILGAALPEDGDGEVAPGADARAWLDGVRHRLDVAIAEEGSS
jgi:hypothetical protein